MRRLLAIAFMCVAVAACKPQASTPSAQASAAADAGGTVPAQTTESDATAICPAADFNGFAAKFASSISVQAKYTHWPLESTSIDAAATPEPKPVTKQVSEQETSYPLLMAFDRAKREGQSIEVTQDPPDGAQIHYTKPDTDYSIRYLFKRQGTCWKLIAIKDESL